MGVPRHRGAVSMSRKVGQIYKDAQSGSKGLKYSSESASGFCRISV
jgi:hypothetical protein